MILVPEGTFRMDSDATPDDQPPRTTSNGNRKAGMNGEVSCLPA
jgi:hypothetical protein